MAGTKTQTGISTTKTIANSEQLGTATFVNDDSNVKRAINSATDSTFEQSNFVESDMSKFFARPILVATYQWSAAADLNHFFDPWSEFLTNPAIMSKLNNYHLLRCKLHVKFVINAVPFAYGRAMMTYAPHNGVKNVPQAMDDESLIMIHSQLPKVFIDPSDQASGELEIPFFFEDNYINLQRWNGQFGAGMGIVQFKNISSFGVALSGATASVNVSVYLWATEVELRVPTSLSVGTQGFLKKGLGIASATISEKIQIPTTMAGGIVKTKMSRSSKSNNEYKPSGILSSAAASVAVVAGALKSVPGLAPYAKATEIGANMAGNVFSFFGYSRPAVIEPPKFYKPLALSSNANTSGAETVSKLTFDPKQETTIDSSVAGIENMDHMTFANILSRESWIAKAVWSENDASGFQVFWCDVTPTYSVMGNPDAFANATIAMSPMAYLTVPFNYWSGTIIYRIQVVASTFHKGRLKIAYEPDSNDTEVDEYNTAYNHIVDLDECREYEFSISWAQVAAYQKITDVRDDTYGTGAVGAYTQGYNNGRFHISIINELSAPVAGAAVDINIYARAGDDFEIFGPAGPFDKLSYKEFIGYSSAYPTLLEEKTSEVIPTFMSGPASEELFENDVETVELVGQSNVSLMERKSVVFHGEVHKSIRSMLRRYDNLEMCIPDAVNMNNNNQYFTTNFRKMYPPGGGQITDPNFSGSGTNHTKTPLVTYFISAFAGFRGGMRYKHVFTGQGVEVGLVEFARTTAIGSYPRTVMNSSDYSNTTNANTAAASMNYEGFEGTYVNNDLLSHGHEIEIPYYSTKRFLTTNILDGYDTGTDLIQDLNYKFTVWLQANKRGDTAVRTVSCQRYVATAEDFNLIWFVNAPVFFVPT